LGQDEKQYRWLEEKALVAMCADGDMLAFEELVLRYEKKVAAAAFRLCGHQQEGEDLAQETFLRAWRAFAGYRGQASFGTWLMAILTNLWRDRLRKGRLPQEPLDQVLEGQEGPVQKQLQDQSPGPEVLTEAAEAGSILGHMLQELKPEYKEVLVLRDVQGFTYEEVAAITGSNLGTVKSRINRARTLMKEKVLHFQEQNPGFFRLNQAKGNKSGAGKVKGGAAHEG
jgi:RNA polymerase sigma-70 factor (ECF subfamily)